MRHARARFPSQRERETMPELCVCEQVVKRAKSPHGGRKAGAPCKIRMKSVRTACGEGRDRRASWPAQPGKPMKAHGPDMRSTITLSNEERGGRIEALELTRRIAIPGATERPTAGAEMRFAGRPVAKKSLAQELRLAFLPEGARLPQPSYDPAEGRIEVFYTMSEYERIRHLLASRKARLCYFWSSADGANKRAWLLTAGA